MDNLALKGLLVCKMGRVSAGVVVVAGCPKHPTTDPNLIFGVYGVWPNGAGRDMPKLIFRMPVGANHRIPVGDPPFQIMFVDSLLEIVEYVSAIGNRMGFGPGFELIAEGIKVRVRPDTGIAEKVPCATDLVS